MPIDFSAWSSGGERAAMAAAYVWLIEHCQQRLLRVAHSHALEGMSACDQVQDAVIAVCRSSLKKRDSGAIPDAAHLERYLFVGAIRQVKFLFWQAARRQKVLNLLQRVQGEATGPQALMALGRVRRQIAEDLREGVEGWSTAAPEQARYVAAEALLEAEAAMDLGQQTAQSLDGAMRMFMAELIEAFALTPDDTLVLELLQKRTCAPYLRWRLGLDGGHAQRNRYYQLRKHVGAKLRQHPEQANLEALVAEVGRQGLAILTKGQGGQRS